MKTSFKYLLAAIISGFLAAVQGSYVINNTKSPHVAYMLFFIFLTLVLLIVSLAKSSES